MLQAKRRDFGWHLPVHALLIAQICVHGAAIPTRAWTHEPQEHVGSLLLPSWPASAHQWGHPRSHYSHMYPRLSLSPNLLISDAGISRWLLESYLVMYVGFCELIPSLPPSLPLPSCPPAKKLKLHIASPTIISLYIWFALGMTKEKTVISGLSTPPLCPLHWTVA